MYDTGEHPAGPQRRWFSLLTLAALLLVGWAVVELTAQPALGVAAVCTKFGWEDFRTGWWLRQRDPNRRRGAACFWLHVASGLWKIAITASLMIFAYIALKLLGLIGGRPAALHLVGAMLTAFCTIGLATVTACRALLLARAGGVRLWLHPHVHRARRADRWPPVRAGQRNLGGTLVGTALFALLVPALFAVMLLGVRQWLGPLQRPVPALVFLAGFPLLCSLLGLGLYYFVRGVLNRRVFARVPEQCWGKAAAPPEAAPPPVVAFIGDEIAASRGTTGWGVVGEQS